MRNVADAKREEAKKEATVATGHTWSYSFQHFKKHRYEVPVLSYMNEMKKNTQTKDNFLKKFVSAVQRQKERKVSFKGFADPDPHPFCRIRY